MIDARLAGAISAHHVKDPPAPFVRAIGSVGELAVAEALSGAIRRVVLVTGVDDSSRTLNIVLATNRTETATDLDIIVDRETSGAPYDLVVEGELCGPIFPEQLDDAIAMTTGGLAEAIAGALATDGDSLVDFRVGLPLADSEDPRRSFKKAELAELMEIVSSCRQWLSGGRSEITTLDPEVLIPPPVGTPIEEGFECLEELLELLDVYEREGYRLSVDLRDLLCDGAADELRRWHTEYGVDIWRRLFSIPYQDYPEILEVADASDLRRVYLTSRAAAGTMTVDFMTSPTHQWSDAIVVTSESEANKSSRGRAVVAGASR